jgi:hypothetical protein
MVATESQSTRARLLALGLGVTGVIAVIGSVAVLTPAVFDPQPQPTAETATLATVPVVTVGAPGANPQTRTEEPVAQVAPLVTPLSAGGLGVAVSGAVRSLARLGERIGEQLREDDSPLEIEVRLADGSPVRAHVLDFGHDDSPALLRLLITARAGGYDLATVEPDARSSVTVMTEQPITIQYRELDQLDPAVIMPGTAVIDADGRLLGLCEHDGEPPGSIRLVLVTEIAWRVSATTAPD